MIMDKQFEIEITDIGIEGQGIGKKGGMAFFVARGRHGPVYGDVAVVEPIETKKNYTKAELIKIVEPSKFRADAFCSYFLECGGCMLQDMTYEGQLALKEKQVRDKLERVSGIKHPKVNSIIGMTDPFRFRNKAEIAIGNSNVGFFGMRSNNVVSCMSCMTNAMPVEAVACAIREFMGAYGVSAYDRLTGKGVLRHAVVKTAFGTGEVMVILVCNGNKLPYSEELIKIMDDAVYAKTGAAYSLESVFLNVNCDRVSQVTGAKCLALAGKRTITDKLCGMEFEISPLSFYQVNPVQTGRLRSKVLEYASLNGGETVLDVYCGVGALGLWCASKASNVLGFESNKDAVLDANRNAVINGIVNMKIIAGLAEDELPRLTGKGFAADVAILDPPRAGCKRELLASVAKTGASRIIQPFPADSVRCSVVVISG